MMGNERCTECSESCGYTGWLHSHLPQRINFIQTRAKGLMADISDKSVNNRYNVLSLNSSEGRCSAFLRLYWLLSSSEWRLKLFYTCFLFYTRYLRINLCPLEGLQVVMASDCALQPLLHHLRQQQPYDNNK